MMAHPPMDIGGSVYENYTVCEYEDCANIAGVGMKAHTLDDRLLDTHMMFFCREHWSIPCREAVNDMLRGGRIRAISIVLP